MNEQHQKDKKTKINLHINLKLHEKQIIQEDNHKEMHEF
jgi:hypothetical protein